MNNRNYNCSYKMKTSNPEAMTIPMKCQQRQPRNLIEEDKRIPKVVNEAIVKNK